MAEALGGVVDPRKVRSVRHPGLGLLMGVLVALLAGARMTVEIAEHVQDLTEIPTDQGGQFCGGELSRVCAAAGIVQSMGRTGSALDNAVAESFHSTIEFEVLSRTRFATREQARRAMAAWLGEYDTVRLHSTNAMVAPVEFEHGRRRPGAKSYDQLRRPKPWMRMTTPFGPTVLA